MRRGISHDSRTHEILLIRTRHLSFVDTMNLLCKSTDLKPIQISVLYVESDAKRLTSQAG